MVRNVLKSTNTLTAIAMCTYSISQRNVSKNVHRLTSEATSQRKTRERLSPFSCSLFVRSACKCHSHFFPLRPCAILEQRNALLQSHCSYSRGLWHRMLPKRAVDLGASVLPRCRFSRAFCTPREFEAELKRSTDER